MELDLMLQLNGTAKFHRGAIAANLPPVFRLRSMYSKRPASARDLTIVATEVELQQAIKCHHHGLIAVGLDVEAHATDVPASLVIGLDKAFEYLGDGDVIGFNPESRRFRVLYRRTSRHNSF